MRRRVMSSLLAGLIGGILFLTVVPGADLVQKKNLDQIKKECEVFENIVNTSLRQAIPHPLLLAEKARGTYLADYGLTFSMTLNLSRQMILFAPRSKRSPENPEDLSRQRAHTIVAIRKCLTEVLSQYGSSFRQLPPDDKISIIAHVLSRSLYANDNTNQIIILTVTKRDIEQYRRARITREELKKRITYIEY